MFILDKTILEEFINIVCLRSPEPILYDIRERSFGLFSIDNDSGLVSDEPYDYFSYRELENLLKKTNLFLSWEKV